MKRRVLFTIIGLVCACNDTDPSGGDGLTSTSGSHPGTATKADTSPEDTDGGTGYGSHSTSGDTSSGLADESSAETFGTGEPDDGSSTGAHETAPLFVHATSGLDSNPGTPDLPMRTIQHALEVASSDGHREIRIAAGHYSAVYADNAALVLHGGVSLRGGFSSQDWNEHNPVEHETRVTGEQPYVLQIDGGTPDDTVVEGLSIWMPDVNAGAAIRIDGGAPSLVANRIRALRTNTQHESTAIGIDVRGGDATIARNWIIASTVGVRLDDTDGLLLDANMILASGSGEHRAVAVESNGDGVVRIEGNALWANGPWSAPYLGDLYEDHLRGNVLHGSQCVLRITEEVTNVPDSSELAFNALECGALYVHYAGVDDSGPNVYTTLAQLDLFVPMAHDNIVRDLILGVGDGGGYPANLYVQGHVVNQIEMGVDCGLARAGWGDEAGRLGFDGEPRTPPWSIGATEIDGPCL